MHTFFMHKIIGLRARSVAEGPPLASEMMVQSTVVSWPNTLYSTIVPILHSISSLHSTTATGIQLLIFLSGRTPPQVYNITNHKDILINTLNPTAY